MFETIDVFVEMLSYTKNRCKVLGRVELVLFLGSRKRT